MDFQENLPLRTSGIVPNIKKLYDEIDVSLAISLHAPDDNLRDEIVPKIISILYLL